MATKTYQQHTALGSSLTTKTISVTLPAGTNLLLVGVHLADAPTVTGATYNGAALTRIMRQTDAICSEEAWYLLDPSTGAAHDLVLTLDSEKPAGTTVLGYTDAHATAPIGTAVGRAGTGISSLSQSVDSHTGGEVVDFITWYNTTVACVPGAGQTLITGAPTSATRGASASSEPGAASVTMSWTLDYGQRLAHIAVPILPAGANARPVAAGSVSVERRTATFTDTSSDPDGTVASISLDWGDGSAAEAVALGGVSSHVYASGGAYTITQTVTDDGGLTATATHAIVTAGRYPYVVVAENENGTTDSNIVLIDVPDA